MEEHHQTESQNSLWLKQPWAKRLLVLLGVILFIVTALPIAAKYIAIHILKDQGFAQVEIGDVDLNLFVGSAGLEDVIISGDSEHRGRLSQLYINISLISLIQKRINIEQFQLNGLTLPVQANNDGSWMVAGIKLPTAKPEEEPATEESPWEIGIGLLEVAGIEIQLIMPQLQTNLTLDNLKLSGLASWEPSISANYQAEIFIDQSRLDLAGTMRPFATIPDFNGNLTLNELPLSLASGFIKDSGVTDLQGKLNLHIDFNAKLDQGQPAVETDTSIRLANIESNYDGYYFKNSDMSWQGKINYLTPKVAEDLGLRLAGEVTINQVELSDTKSGIDLIALKQLNLNQLELKERQQVITNEIVLDDLILISKKKQNNLLRVSGLNISKVSFDSKRNLSINNMMLKGLNGDIRILPDSKLYLLDEVTNQLDDNETVKEISASEVTQDKQQEQFKIKLAQLRITNSSRISFVDESVKPTYKAVIDPIEITVDNINSVDLTQDAIFNFQSSINKHQKVSFIGKVKPFGESIDMIAKGEIKAVDLPPLSPYMNKQMGYYLKQGQLKSVIDAAISDNQMNIKITAHLNKLKLEEGNPAQAKELSDKLSMPLDAALNLLRDKNDNIKLDVVVDGDIADPQFDISRVINKALAKATTMAVTGYLKFMLQPWGTLLTVAEMVSEGGVANLDPIDFEPGEVVMNSEYDEYLEKLTALLQERPNINLNICGVTSEQDRAALIEQSQGKQTEISNEQLLALVTERTQLIKDGLMEKGADPARLFTCQPNMEKADKNNPQVLLTI